MIISTLQEWKQHYKTCGNYFAYFDFYAYHASDNEFCLAKILRKQRHGFQFMHQIQIGNISNALEDASNEVQYQQEASGTNDHDCRNIVWVPSNKLIKLYVPLSLSTSDYVDDDGTNEIHCQRWIITDKIYNDGLATCLDAIKYAKNGDWLSFKTQIAENKNIIGIKTAVFSWGERKCGTYGDFVFFKHHDHVEKVVATAIRNNQKDFILSFIKWDKYEGSNNIRRFRQHPNDLIMRDFNRRMMINQACMYGRRWIFENVSFDYSGACRAYDLNTMHILVRNKHYDLLQQILASIDINCRNNLYRHQHQSNGNNNNQNTNSSLDIDIPSSTKIAIRKQLFTYDSNEPKTYLLGTAIIANDLKFVKILMNWYNTCSKKLKHKNLSVFNADSFVWNGNTAIQTAIMLFQYKFYDNFEMIKFLLTKHNPNEKYHREELFILDEKDSYLKWQIDHWVIDKDGNWRFVEERVGLKGSITFKPDCEGYTIDERIDQCKKEKLMNNRQCEELKSILTAKRQHLHIENLEGIAG